MSRPNILILYTDQQRWDALGANGNDEIVTPNLDRLAADGVNFRRHFVQNPVCMPSRVSFLTGRYPSDLGIPQMGVPVPEDLLTLPGMLHNHGYTSGNIGKLHFLPHANRHHEEVHPSYGFDTLIISDEPGCYEDAYRTWARARKPDQAEKISVGLPPARERWENMMGWKTGISHPDRQEKGPIPFPTDDDLTHSAFVADQTIQFIRENSDRPFMAIAGFYSPHSPWVTPQKYLDMYDPATLSPPQIPQGWTPARGGKPIPEEEVRAAKQGYYGMVTEVDDYVGQILDALEAEGLADDTIVVFTSDHGEYLGDHHRYAKGPPGHDPVTRVPCIVRWPAGAKGGQTIDSIIEAVDIVPTLLDACAIPIPRCVQGRSLLPVLKGEAESVRDVALMEFSGVKNIRTDRYRYVAYQDGRETLYDLETDPGEYVDVAGDPEYAGVLAEHRSLLIQKVFETQTPIERIWLY